MNSRDSEPVFLTRRAPLRFTGVVAWMRLLPFALTLCVLLGARPSSAQDCGDREIDVSVLMASTSGDLFSYVRLLSALPASDDTVLAVYGEGDYTGASPNFVEYDVTWTVPRCNELVWVESNVVVQHFLSPDMIFLSESREVDMTVPGEWDFQMEEGTLFLADIQIETAGFPGSADSDDDGLLDCEEEAGGIDVNCDGALQAGSDIVFSALHDVPPDPSVPDIYVEVDWADCDMEFGRYQRCDLIDDRTMAADRRSFEPPQEVFDLIEDEFLEHGYQLHFSKSGSFPATMGVPAKKAAGPVSGGQEILPSLAGLNSRQAWYSVYWRDSWEGQGVENPGPVIYSYFFGEIGDSRAVVAEKAKFMRYNIWSHTGTDLAFWGVAESIGGRWFSVGQDTSWPIAPLQAGLPLRTPTPTGGTTADEAPQIWAAVVMHELGHTLGLGHGGRLPNRRSDSLNYKPNYLSVMNYQYRYRLDGSSRSVQLPQLRYNEIDRTFDQCALSEVASPPTFLPPLVSNEEFTVRYNCPGRWLDTYYTTTDRGGAIDWNCDGEKAGAGNFNFFQFKCMKAQAVALPVPSGLWNDDRIVSGAIRNAEDPTMPPHSEPHPQDDGVTNPHVIGAGADGFLDTEVAPGDYVVGGWIDPGPDGVCDTEAFYEADGTTPVQGLVDVRAIGAEKPCNLLATDDWDRLSVQFPDSPRTGNADSSFVPGEDPGDESPFEADWRFRQQLAVDLSLQETAAAVDAVARTLSVEYTVTNHSSEDSSLAAAVSLAIPEGTDLQGCSGETLGCTQFAGRVVAEVPAVPAGASISFTILLLLDCPAWGDEFTLISELSTEAVDPQPSNDSHQSTHTFGADLAVSSSARPWVRSYSGAQPVSLSEDGEVVLSCGNTIFESPSFDTLELGSVSTEFLADVFVPFGSPSGWVGDLQLHIDVPSGNLWNQWVGYNTLSTVPQGTWTTLRFDLPQAAYQVLLGDYPGARLRFAANVASCSHAVLFRNVRMGEPMECQPGRAADDLVISTSVLTFDSVSEWEAESASIGGTGAGTQGSGAVAFDPTGWGRLVSRPFLTSELEGATDALALDVYIPDLPSDFYWLGGINLFLDCPTAGLWNTWIGYQALQILFDGEFNRVTYSLRPEVVNVLQEPSVQCRVALEVSSNPAFGGFVLDNGGFVQ